MYDVIDVDLFDWRGEIFEVCAESGVEVLGAGLEILRGSCSRLLLQSEVFHLELYVVVSQGQIFLAYQLDLVDQ